MQDNAGQEVMVPVVDKFKCSWECLRDWHKQVETAAHWRDKETIERALLEDLSGYLSSAITNFAEGRELFRPGNDKLVEIEQDLRSLYANYTEMSLAELRDEVRELEVKVYHAYTIIRNSYGRPWVS